MGHEENKKKFLEAGKTSSLLRLFTYVILYVISSVVDSFIRVKKCFCIYE